MILNFNACFKAFLHPIIISLTCYEPARPLGLSGTGYLVISRVSEMKLPLAFMLQAIGKCYPIILRVLQCYCLFKTKLKTFFFSCTFQESGLLVLIIILFYFYSFYWFQLMCLIIIVIVQQFMSNVLSLHLSIIHLFLWLQRPW